VGKTIASRGRCHVRHVRRETPLLPARSSARHRGPHNGDRNRARARAPAGLTQSAIEESLRLEPAAATIDRYAARDVRFAGASIRQGDLVTISIAGANRDPDTFPDPNRFDIRRANARQHVAFAHGPHVCIGMHLARLEAHTAITRALARFPSLRLDPAHSAPATRGLVFRKPPAIHAVWS
jgi:cytochrome P450